jgi:SAM-dependent methyltransferase
VILGAKQSKCNLLERLAKSALVINRTLMGDLLMKNEADGSVLAASGINVNLGAQKFSTVPILSNLSRRLKKHYFLNTISPNQAVLEIGCGDGWVGRHLQQRGIRKIVDIDTTPAATINGDIRDWRDLGLNPASFDVIVAFEVLEHVDCVEDCFALLKPGGRLMITSPFPPADPVLELLEKWHLNQPRTSPHDHLTYFKETEMFGIDRMWRPIGLSQWCILRKKPQRRPDPKNGNRSEKVFLETADLVLSR